MQNILVSTTFWGIFIDLFMSLNAITYNMYNVLYERFLKKWSLRVNQGKLDKISFWILHFYN